MKLNRLFFIFFVAATVLTACTVERRLYRPGYHVEWKSRNTDSRSEAPVSRNLVAQPKEEALTAQESRATEPEDRLQATDSVVIADVRSAEAPTLPAVDRQVSGKPSTERPAVRLKDRVPEILKLHKDESSQVSVQQGTSKAIGGLILAPLRIIFTLLLIALVAAGLILLFVLESSLGGTVLLAAGAVLLILIIL